jgi:predicted restriction endonuclease
MAKIIIQRITDAIDKQQERSKQDFVKGFSHYPVDAANQMLLCPTL